MFQALGRGVQRNRDKTFTAKVEFIDDRTGRSAGAQTFTAASIGDLQAQVRLELMRMKAAETDVALTAAIVDVLLGEV